MADSTFAHLITMDDDQVVLIPEGFELDSDRVRVSREGRKIVLEPVPSSPEE